VDQPGLETAAGKDIQEIRALERDAAHTAARWMAARS
jgi:hypothetical protein